MKFLVHYQAQVVNSDNSIKSVNGNSAQTCELRIPSQAEISRWREKIAAELFAAGFGSDIRGDITICNMMKLAD